VREKFPETVSSLEKLFKDFTKFAQNNGIIVVDTKFEIFVDAKGQWVLGDEVLTPESSRFISSEDFNAGNYISMDKQILRDFGKSENWKEKAKDLKAGQKLDVNVPDSIKNGILNGYSTILNRLSK
jgi:phosphoribosylaminoimidazole-succinocarboxamide synthase